MGEYFNQRRHTERRRLLRKNAPTPERVLWSRLRGKQLGFKFRRQFGIGPYVVDFCCPKEKLVIEVDGESHFTRSGIEYDEVRDVYSRAAGMNILRFTNKQIMNELDGVVETIKKQFDSLK